jgi:hypothetical protein
VEACLGTEVKKVQICFEHARRLLKKEMQGRGYRFDFTSEPLKLSRTPSICKRHELDQACLILDGIGRILERHMPALTEFFGKDSQPPPFLPLAARSRERQVNHPALGSGPAKPGHCPGREPTGARHVAAGDRCLSGGLCRAHCAPASWPGNQGRASPAPNTSEDNLWAECRPAT